MSEKVMREQDRLGPLEVGVTGKVRVAGGDGPIEKNFLKPMNPPRQFK